MDQLDPQEVTKTGKTMDDAFGGSESGTDASALLGAGGAKKLAAGFHVAFGGAGVPLVKEDELPPEIAVFGKSAGRR